MGKRPPVPYTGEKEVRVVDATDVSVGRLAAYVAKLLLQDIKVYVINVEKALFLGGQRTVRRYKEREEIQSHVHPDNTPRHPTTPVNIFRRVVRGMLPWKKPKGKKAYRRLRVFVGSPPHLAPYAEHPLPRLDRLALRTYISVGELSRVLRGGQEVVTEVKVRKFKG